MTTKASTVNPSAADNTSDNVTQAAEVGEAPDPTQLGEQVTKAAQALEDFAQAIEDERQPLISRVTNALISGDVTGRDAAIRRIDSLQTFLAAAQTLGSAWNAFLTASTPIDVEASLPYVTLGAPPSVNRGGRPRRVVQQSENGDPDETDGEQGDDLPQTSKRQYIPWFMKAMSELPHGGGQNGIIQQRMWDLMVGAGATQSGDGVQLTSGTRWKKRTDHVASDIVAAGYAFKATDGGYYLNEQGKNYVQALALHESGQAPPPPPITTRPHSGPTGSSSSPAAVATNGNAPSPTPAEEVAGEDLNSGTLPPQPQPAAPVPVAAGFPEPPGT